MPVAVFDVDLFRARYPQFASVPDGRLRMYFLEAGTLHLSNSDRSRVRDVYKRLLLLNMLVAHLSELNGDLAVDGQAKPVGRVSQAAEGSVSATLEYSVTTTGTAAWYNQTQFGADFWTATAYLRSAKYSPRPTTWR